MSDRRQAVDRIAGALGDLHNAKRSRWLGTPEGRAYRRQWAAKRKQQDADYVRRRTERLEMEARVLDMLKEKTPFPEIMSECGISRKTLDTVRRNNGGLGAFPAPGWRNQTRTIHRRPRAAAPPPPPPTDTKTLDQIGVRQCHYPYGDGPFVFCGEPTAGIEHVYCPGHEAVCWDFTRTQRSIDEAA